MSKNIIIGIISVAVLMTGVFLLLKKPATVNNVAPTKQQSITSTTPTPTSTSIKSTSSATTKKTVAGPQILSAQMSTGLSSSGVALRPATVFSPTTPIIYAVLTLKNAIQRTQLSYIRYYEGKYVDSKVSHPSKNGTQYFHFNWELKAGKTRKIGNYSLVFYVDGKKTQTISYSIK